MLHVASKPLPVPGTKRLPGQKTHQNMWCG